MPQFPPRRPRACSAAHLAALLTMVALLPAGCATRCAADDQQTGAPVETVELNVGDLAVEFRDNTQSPQILSGVDRLFNTKDAPGFDAFDPNDPPSSAGLNFEHIISGHHDSASYFAPRHGIYRLYRSVDPNAVVLVRRHTDDPWSLESTMQYTVVPPHYIDFEFSCRPYDANRFGDRRYALLFWADYMNNVDDVALHFRGLAGPGEAERWIAADAPAGHPDYVGGGTYRHAAAPALEYDADHNIKLNVWSYEYPRFTRPFYFGRAEQGMTLMLMFDRAFSEEDEIRFSLFKFKVGDQVRRPAWDFQYVIHRVATGRQYGFRGRLVWKKYVSDEDCLREYETWSAALPADWRPDTRAHWPAAVPDGVPTDREPVQAGRGWQVPPTGRVIRREPRLMNYFHLDFREGRVAQKEERLAQWNLLILNHDLVQHGRLSLARMRQINPRIKILAWVPLQGPNGGLAPGVPSEGADDWFARRADGTLIVPHWGGNLMNAYTQDYAWPRHVLDYVQRECLTPGGYNGLLLDCLWPSEPDEQDVNKDGRHDGQDTQAWQEAMLFLLNSLRAQFPHAILVGNAGDPWPDDCPYFRYANGCMHENALGDQFGSAQWQDLWDGYRRTLGQVQGREPYHLIAVDVRADKRTQFLAAWQWRLSSNDRRRSRLGLATSLLLDGGYFGFDRGDCLHGQLWWLPEYDLDLGAPLQACQSDRYAPGTYSRLFTHGLVIVNPTDRDVAVTVTAPRLDVTRAVSGTDFVVPAGDACFLAGHGAE